MILPDLSDRTRHISERHASMSPSRRYAMPSVRERSRRRLESFGGRSRTARSRASTGSSGDNHRRRRPIKTRLPASGAVPGRDALPATKQLPAGGNVTDCGQPETADDTGWMRLPGLPRNTGNNWKTTLDFRPVVGLGS